MGAATLLLSSVALADEPADQDAGPPADQPADQGAGAPGEQDAGTPGDPLPAELGDFALKIEPGLALPITDPQSKLFTLGGGQSIKALWALTPWFDVGPSLGFMTLANKNGLAAGTAITLGGGVQLKRPHDAPDDDWFLGASPWLDADTLYVRTGDLNRPGFDVAAGIAVPVGRDRAFWIGPFVRYFHIIQQPARSGYDNHDAMILSAGVSLALGADVRRVPEPEPAPEVRIVSQEVIREVPKETFICSDRDTDGVPDTVDRCPDVAGTVELYGCPYYPKIIIQKDKLELREKLFFDWDSAVLQPVSFPVLDDVVQALKDNKSFHVQVEGHTSSEGGPVHNQGLSERRAQAVLGYLVAHGVPPERLVSKGFGSTVSIDSNTTPGGREKNRRVEFLVNPTNLNDGNQ